MRFAICLSNFGTYADPHAAVRVALAAEAAGWDGFFMWDHLAFVWGPQSADPWVTLAAIASATEQLTLGTAVTPLPRRRPQVVAQQVGTLDRLNGGPVVLGAGLGGNEKEFTAFGEDFDPHRRAKLLDDGLELVRKLWQGPIWIGGNSAPALRRASRWDGWIANSVIPDWSGLPAMKTRTTTAATMAICHHTLTWLSIATRLIPATLSARHIAIRTPMVTSAPDRIGTSPLAMITVVLP